jgi:hypothetical protein
MQEEILSPQVNQELTVIDKSIDIFKGAPDILKAHRSRVQKALAVGLNIVTQWENAFMIEDPEARESALASADERTNKFLVNCGIAKTEMEDSRKAITQLMDVIKKMFTEEENKLDPKKDTIPAKLQSNRNQYAKEVLDIQERKRKEADLRAAKAKEESDIRVFIRNAITQCLIDFLAKKKLAITNTFNAITMDDFDEKTNGLGNLNCNFPLEQVNSIIKYVMPATIRHSQGEVIDFDKEERNNYDYPSFCDQYKVQLTELKESLIDRLPSKRDELLEQKRIADEAVTKRQVELKRAEEAEKNRQLEIAKSKNEAERKKKELEAEVARKAEAERLAEIEREAEERRIKAAREQQLRRDQERQKLALEAEGQRKAADQKAEMEKAAGTTQSLFDQAVETSSIGAAPETRSGFNIVVTHPAGLVELFTFWFQRESVNLSIDEMLNRKLDQMKAYAEKAALKGERIESKFLKYEPITKAVNRKAKP